MGALLLALVLGGMALAMANEAKAKGKALPEPEADDDEGSAPSSPLPTDEAPQDATQAGAEAVNVAEQAAAAAAKAAREAIEAMMKGQKEEAAKKADEASGHAQEATRASDAAAPTPGAQSAAELAKQAADAAIKAAEATGITVPPELKSAGVPSSGVTPDDVIVKSPGQPTQVITDQETRAIKDAETALEPTKAPPVPAVSKETSLPAEETKPENDPNGTIALARLLLERETAPAWREALKSAVKTWQLKTGLVADGKFGPKGALRMAEEAGIIPLVRFWPSGSQKAAALADYRAQLRALADSIAKTKDGEAHAAALRQSAAVEDARAYGNPNAPPLSSAQRAATGG